MQEEVSSMDPWSIFLYGMKAPMTREKYRGRLAKFFDFIGLTEGTTEYVLRKRKLYDFCITSS